MDRIVLAYSGGPASSVAIPWLIETQPADVVAVTVDLGQRATLEGIRHRALTSGAVRAHVLDRREAYVRRFVLPVIQSGAAAASLDGAGVAATGHALLAEALARPIIAQALVEIAHIEGAHVVAHAAAGDKDSLRLGAAVSTLDRTLRVVPVAREWRFGPGGFEDYAKAHGIPLAADADVARPQAAAPLDITITFRAGIPVAVNGVEMDLVELPDSLDVIAAAQGVSGLVALAEAHGALQRRVQPAASAARMAAMRAEYAALIDSGRWFTPEREAIDAAMAALQASVNGEARLTVFNGTCEVIDRVQ